MRRIWLAACALAVACMTVSLYAPLSAQEQCGEVQAIRYPIDTTGFQLAQDFDVASPRHHGRYHTGEDWYGVRDGSLGQPVVAIANGRVTYASANGWGRDGGVVILEHTFPDGSVLYSAYGHLMETEAIRFPAVLTCVREGDIIGAVGDARPAPHLHFEIKTNNPNLPGPGYSWEPPVAGGWRRPVKVVRNWQTWLLPAHRWHLDLNDETGPQTAPVMLADQSLIYLDTGRVGRLTNDGRVLWRVNLDRPAAGLIPSGDSAAVVYADGGLQAVTIDGALGESWSLGLTLDAAPLLLPDLILLHTADNQLAAADLAGRSVLWTVENVPPLVRWHGTSALIGVITESNELLTLSADGNVLDRATLRSPGAFATGPEGALVAYTRGGLWTIGLDGTWSELIPNVAPGVASGAVARDNGGFVYLFDGDLLSAYDPTGVLLWQVALPGLEGDVHLDLYGPVLLVTTTHGHVITVQAATGAGCNTAQIYGDAYASAWHNLGSDGMLRLAVSDQILGLDWVRFLNACA